MSLLNNRCLVKETASQSYDLRVALLAGKLVCILPESVQFSPKADDHFFNVVVPGESAPPGNEEIVICSRFLEPVSPSVKKLFQELKKK